MDIIVADTSPLIFLAKLALLDTVCKKFHITTTSIVYAEATRKKELPDAKQIQFLSEKGHITIHAIDNEIINKYQENWGLGKGEASAFALLESTGDYILCDDYAAIGVARANSISYITTPVLIYEMAQRKMISTKKASEKLEAIRQYSWIDSEIIKTVTSWFEGRR